MWMRFGLGLNYLLIHNYWNNADVPVSTDIRPVVRSGERWGGLIEKISVSDM